MDVRCVEDARPLPALPSGSAMCGEALAFFVGCVELFVLAANRGAPELKGASS